MKTRGEQDPTGEKQVSYRPRNVIQPKTDAQASRHLPQVASAGGSTQRWDSRRIGQWQPLGPPFSFWDQKFQDLGGGQGHSNRPGQDSTVSEAFRGEFSQKVDGKARVSIPAPFRRVLEAGDPTFDGSRPKFVMVYGGGTARQFVECYTLAEMKRLEARIRRMPPGTAQRKALERNFITLSQTVEVDEDGRIVLPPKVREKVGLTAEALKDSAEAVFAGTLETFQIWRSSDYEAEMAAQEEVDLDLPEGADLLSLLPFDAED